MSLLLPFVFTAAELVPSLCVTASITPSISPVVSGSTVTLTCLVYSDIGLSKTSVTIVHEMTNGTIRELLPQLDSTLNSFQYISLLHNVTSEEDEGIYTCVAVIKEFNVEVNDSITLNISDTSRDSIFTTSHSFSLSVSSSSLITSPTQVLQPEDSNDITLILVTIIPGFILLTVVVLIIIIIFLVGMVALVSSKRTYEADHKVNITNIIYKQ